jgi:hypothetical protein
VIGWTPVLVNFLAKRCVENLHLEQATTTSPYLLGESGLAVNCGVRSCEGGTSVKQLLRYQHNTSDILVQQLAVRRYGPRVSLMVHVLMHLIIDLESG